MPASSQRRSTERIRAYVYCMNGPVLNYHFQVLSMLLDRLGFSWGKDLVHFSYGMVELPEGTQRARTSGSPSSHLRSMARASAMMVEAASASTSRCTSATCATYSSAQASPTYSVPAATAW